MSKKRQNEIKRNKLLFDEEKRYRSTLIACREAEGGFTTTKPALEWTMHGVGKPFQIKLPYVKKTDDKANFCSF